MRRVVGIALTAIAACMGASASLPRAVHASTATDLVLLGKYEPVMVYDSPETWRPMAVSAFSTRTTLQQVQCGTFRCGWNSLITDPHANQIPIDGCAANTGDQAGCYRLNINDCDFGSNLTTSPGDEDTCYLTHSPASAQLQKTGSPSNSVSYVYGRAFHRLSGDDGNRNRPPVLVPLLPERLPQQARRDLRADRHGPPQGDWEMVQVMLDTQGAPVWMAYSQHTGGGRRGWSTVPRYNGTTHPMVWVATGSHANYPAAGTWPAQQIHFPGTTISFDDHTAPATGWMWGLGPSSLRPTMPLNILQVTGSGPTLQPAWLHYAGAWGKDEWLVIQDSGAWHQFGCKITFSAISCTGPVGPAAHAIWQRPVSEALSWKIE